MLQSKTRCLECQAETPNPKFCSRSCSASFNNRLVAKRKGGGGKFKSGKTPCPGGCGVEVNRSAVMCIRCHKATKRQEMIHSWLSGTFSGGSDYGLSRVIRQYLIDLAGNACSKCGWSIPHPDDGIVPLEINHIDGDGTNHSPDNLEVLCANCHSLTSSYRGRNAGNGRPVFYHRNTK